MMGFIILEEWDKIDYAKPIPPSSIVKAFSYSPKKP